MSKLAPCRGHLTRAAFAHLRASVYTSQPDVQAAHLWKDDSVTAAILKAPATLPVASDHGAIITTAVGDFLAHMSQSAASRLMRDSLTIRLDADASVSVPFDTEPAATLPWVGEGAAIPVSEAALSAAVLGPHRKVAVLLAVSRETARAPDAERVLSSILRARASLAFDAAFFSTTDGGADGVAGVLHGLQPADVQSAEGVGEALAVLAGAVADGGGSGNLAIVAHPRTAAVIQMQHPHLAWPVLPSRAVPVGRAIAIDPGAVAFGLGSDLDISRDGAATLHMSSAPDQLVDGTAADPVRSLWQTDGIGMRVIFDLAFVARPGAVAFCEGIG